MRCRIGHVENDYTSMQRDVKTEPWILPPEEPGCQVKVRCTGNRQKFRQSLDYRQDYDLDQRH